MSATCSTGVKINGNLSLTEVPFGFCQFTFPGAHGVSREDYSEVIYLVIICSFKRDQRGREEECSSLSVCPTQMEKLSYPGARVIWSCLHWHEVCARQRFLSLCRGIIVPCLLTKTYFLKPCLSHDLVRSGLPSSTNSGILQLYKAGKKHLCL